MQDASSGDWRSQFPPEARRNNREYDKRHLPISVPEGLNKLQKIAFRFVNKIYTAAANKSDYLRKNSLKLLSMGSKSQHPGAPGQINPFINQNPVDPATLDSIAPTGHVAVADLQEEIYQKIRSIKDLYFADLNELHKRTFLKLQQNDAVLSAKAAEQFEKVKDFMMMLKRILQVLQLSKANINPSLKDKIPAYEKLIQNILASYKKKVIPSQPPGQQQLQHPSSHSQLVQQQQQTQVPQLQQHDNYANQQNNIQATLDSIAPTGHVAVADLQEEIYQQIRSMKDLYFADLNDLHQRISRKLQKNDALPSAKAAEQFEKLKAFKMMLERILQVLQLSKANLSPSLKDKIPMYEKLIQNSIASKKKKVIPSQPPGQQQLQHPSSHSQLVQQQQQTQVSQLQQHDNYANQQNNIQGSSNSMQTPAVQNMQHGSVSLSAHFGVTSQQNISTINQNAVDPEGE